MGDNPESSSMSMELVMSNNDLLTEILARLPVVSLVLFKSVSKRWNSLIIDHNARLTLRRNLDLPSGLFFQNHIYDFVSLDKRIPHGILRRDVDFCNSFRVVFGKRTWSNCVLIPSLLPRNSLHCEVRIMQSCNGLLLCRSTLSKKFYVYNPSVTNMFKLIPEPDNVRFDIDAFGGGFRLAFDPTKSPHYKLIYAQKTGDHYWADHQWDERVQIQIYSSETGNWSLCGQHFSQRSFKTFWWGVYWNDAIYWIHSQNKLFKLDITNEDPVFTASQTPKTLDLKVHNKSKLFVSRGCLLLFSMKDACSQHFTIFEKSDVYSERWSVKYIVNLDDIINPFPKRKYEYPRVLCIVLGEREEDSDLVMELDKKVVVLYNIASKIVDTIYLGPIDNQYITCFPFIPSFANV